MWKKSSNHSMAQIIKGRIHGRNGLILGEVDEQNPPLQTDQP